jgi:hypothetical protein
MRDGCRWSVRAALVEDQCQYVTYDVSYYLEILWEHCLMYVNIVMLISNFTFP